jgi:hypothetical protein
MGILLDLLKKVLFAVLDRLTSGFFQSIDKTAGPPHDERQAAYLDRFVHAPRTPEWDPSMLSPERLAKAEVRLSEMAGTHFSSAACAPRLRWSRVMSVNRFLNRVMGLSWRPFFLRPLRRHCFVVIGNPASGKSVLSVQAAQLLAHRGQEKGRGPIPVYVNLTHFTSAYELSEEGLRQLVARSIDHDCSRYLPNLPPTASPEPSEEAVRLLDGPTSRLLIFLDGVDEMPVTDGNVAEHNRRLGAIASFVRSYTQHRFVITCRESDYVTIRDYNHDFQMGLYKVQPWTKAMFTNYVDARSEENVAGLQAITQALGRAGSTDLWGQFADSPFLAALLFGGGNLPAATTITTAWQNFVTAFLRPKFASEARYAEAHATMELFGFLRTMEPSRPYPLPESILGRACDAGMMVRSEPNPEFAIKPLQSYFAARYVWRRIREGASEMEDLDVCHPKLRVMFLMVSEIARDAPEFSAYLVKLATSAPDSRRAAQFLALCAACVTVSLLRANPELTAALIDLLERVFRSQDAGNMQIAIQAMQKCPEILILGSERSKDLTYAIALQGSDEGKRRLLRLLVVRASVAAAFSHPLRLVLAHFIRRASLQRELHQLIAVTAAGRPRTGLGHRCLRIALRLSVALMSAVYLYGLYLLSLETAHRLAGTDVSLLPHPDGATTLALFPSQWADAGVRLLFVLLCVWVPWRIVTAIARADLGFRSWGLRLGVVLLMGATGRYMMLLPAIGEAPATVLSTGLEYAMLSASAVLTALVPSALIAAYARRRPAPAAPAPYPTPSPAPPDASKEIEIEMWEPADVPNGAQSRSTEGYFASLLRQGRAYYQQLAKRPARFWVRFLVLLTLLVVATLVAKRYLGARLAVIGVGGVTLAGFFAYYGVWRPSREHAETKARFLKAFSGLRTAYAEELERLFALIADRRVPRRHRLAYIALLEQHVRWDLPLLLRCQVLLESKHFPGESRRALAEAVAHKLPEVEQNSNPGWGRGKLDALFKRAPSP